MNKEKQFSRRQKAFGLRPFKENKKIVRKTSCGKPIYNERGEILIYCGDDLGGDKGEFAQCSECCKKDLGEKNG